MSTTTLISLEQVREIISYDPATGEEIGRAPAASPEDVRQAVARAREAQPAWAKLSFRERGRVILQARKLMLAERDEIARLVSRETGKPVAEALSMEIVPTLESVLRRELEGLLRERFALEHTTLQVDHEGGRGLIELELPGS